MAIDAADAKFTALTSWRRRVVPVNLTRTLRNGIDQEATRVENGLTLIASAGSAAPYIGLFGTVGIYHALIKLIVWSRHLDKVAGPVGEALNDRAWPRRYPGRTCL